MWQDTSKANTTKRSVLIPGNPCPVFKKENFYGITQPITTNQFGTLGPLSLSERPLCPGVAFCLLRQPLSVYGVCISLNKSPFTLLRLILEFFSYVKPRTLTWWPVPGMSPRPGTWPSSCTSFFLQHSHIQWDNTLEICLVQSKRLNIKCISWALSWIAKVTDSVTSVAPVIVLQGVRRRSHGLGSKWRCSPPKHTVSRQNGCCMTDFLLLCEQKDQISTSDS